jgi:hypothetical protein
MKAKLTAIGDEHGLIIDKKVLELLKISPDTELEVSTDAGCLIVELAAGAPRLARTSDPSRSEPVVPDPIEDEPTTRVPKKKPR